MAASTFAGDRQRPVRPLPGAALVPGPRRGRAGGRVSEPACPPRRSPRCVGQPPPTPEQVVVIEAPLGPSLVVAGAGSGKTETMAARVVWLLANGLVEPDQVLGPDVHPQGGRRARRAGAQAAAHPRAGGRGRGRRARRAGRPRARSGSGRASRGRRSPPTTPTRRRSCPTTRCGSASTRRRGCSARPRSGSSRSRSSRRGATTSTPTPPPRPSIEAVLALSGALDEHLLDAAQARVAGSRASSRRSRDARRARRRASRTPRSRSCCGRWGSGVRVLELVADVPGAQARRRRDRLRRPGGAGRAARPRGARGRRRRARAVPGRAARRVPGHLLRAARPCSARCSAAGTRSPRSATRTSRSTAGAARARAASSGSPTSFPQVAPGRRALAGRRPPAVDVVAQRPARSSRPPTTSPRRCGRRPPGSRCPVLAARPGAGEGHVHAHVAETVEDEARAVAQFVARPVAARAAPGRDRRDGRGAVPQAVPVRDAAPGAARRGAAGRGRRPRRAAVARPRWSTSSPLLQAAHDPSRGDALMRLLTGRAHPARRGGPARARGLVRRAGARHGGAARAARRRRRADRPCDDVVVEADAVDERSIVDALDATCRPAGAGPAAAGRTLTRGRRGRGSPTSRGLLRALRAHTYLSVPELVGEAERLLGLDIEVAARARTLAGPRAGAPRRVPRRRRRVRPVGRPPDTSAASSPGSRRPTPRENGLDMPVAEPDPDAVQLITVHAAKGLEWDVVAVAGPGRRRAARHGDAGQGRTEGLGVADRARRAALPAARRPRTTCRTFAYAGAAGPQGARGAAPAVRRSTPATTRSPRSAGSPTSRSPGPGRTCCSPRRGGATARGVRKVSTFLTELAEAGLVRTGGWDGGARRRPGRTRAPSLVPTATWPADPFGADTGPSRRAHVEEAAARRRAQAVARHGAPTPTRRPTPADARRATPTGGRCAAAPVGRARRPAARRARARADALAATSSCPRTCRRPRWCGSTRDPAEFARAPAPPGARRAVAAGAPRHARSTPGSRAGTGAPSLVDVDALPGADDDSAALDADERRAARGVPGHASGRTARRSRSRWTSRRRSTATCCARASTRCSRTRRPAPDVPGSPVVVVDWKTGAPADGRGRARVPRAPARGLPARVVALDGHPARARAARRSATSARA